ncbi:MULTISPECIES: PadR family transcriptional regulator [Amycolatopsis]|uniref:PadR family transcriptional regulator, regulatory protein PadR n=2 Tax=Amycolatopsis TaxID=1813 RepID=A0A1I3JSG6_9PSEU|nr:PadR family transcriptional regulator [Amycolatopsis sacchari]SFI62958.1 PadR family transcriptional regulator, regulatory protein PadR [Amycolatopsis sacchari]
MDSDRRAQWLRGVLAPCVLALLARRESYGYELARELAAAGLGEIPGGTLYPLLLRLERDHLVESVWREGTTGPARKYYRATTAGRRALRELTADWEVFSRGVASILGKGQA